jgi:hypothetical protein
VPVFSGAETKQNKQPPKSNHRALFACRFRLVMSYHGVLLGLEHGGCMFLRNVCELPSYKDRALEDSVNWLLVTHLK